MASVPVVLQHPGQVIVHEPEILHAVPIDVELDDDIAVVDRLDESHGQARWEGASRGGSDDAIAGRKLGAMGQVKQPGVVRVVSSQNSLVATPLDYHRYPAVDVGE